MSDLHCPATLLVLRHGHAESADADRLDDRDGGRLSARGRAQAVAVAESLTDRNVSAVWTSARGRARETADVLAARLGVGITVDDDLREFEIGALTTAPVAASWDVVGAVYQTWVAGDLDASFAGGEDGHQVRSRVAAALQQVADLHRGETVLVVSHGGAMGVTLPRLADNLPYRWAADHDLDNCAMVEIVADGDGWRCVSWAGTRV